MSVSLFRSSLGGFNWLSNASMPCSSPAPRSRQDDVRRIFQGGVAVEDGGQHPKKLIYILMRVADSQKCECQRVHEARPDLKSLFRSGSCSWCVLLQTGSN